MCLQPPANVRCNFVRNAHSRPDGAKGVGHYDPRPNHVDHDYHPVVVPDVYGKKNALHPVVKKVKVRCHRLRSRQVAPILADLFVEETGQHSVTLVHVLPEVTAPRDFVALAEHVEDRVDSLCARPLAWEQPLHVECEAHDVVPIIPRSLQQCTEIFEILCGSLLKVFEFIRSAESTSIFFPPPYLLCLPRSNSPRMVLQCVILLILCHPFCVHCATVSNGPTMAGFFPGRVQILLALLRTSHKAVHL
mmetsp:Transcript_5133/g.10316  ORF Transcript_5133/g.10316 Transcript_5133/m.10316 type:complete len:248 (+) Transcript_5133:177-920(+)